MTDPFDTVRAGIRIHLAEPSNVMVALEANALAALASIEERLAEAKNFGRIPALLDRAEAAERIAHDHGEALIKAEARIEALERERDALQHIIDCADTPLMRDVLKERDEALNSARTLENQPTKEA